MSEQPAFERIVASVYDAMLDETHWPATWGHFCFALTDDEDAVPVTPFCVTVLHPTLERPEMEPEEVGRRMVTGGDGTNAGRILDAAAALAGADGRKTFSRKAVREYLGLNNRAWQSGYTAIFQGMRDDHLGGAPKVGNSYSGVFHRVDLGTYELSAKVVRLVEMRVSMFRDGSELR